jgi:hypothetical protein
MIGRLCLPGKQPEDWLDEVKAWQEMGATHVSVEARRGVLGSVDGHIDAIPGGQGGYWDLAASSLGLVSEKGGFSAAGLSRDFPDQTDFH